MGADEPTRFVAMEYYRLIWNRTFEITLTSSAICGAFVQGVIASNSPSLEEVKASGDAIVLADPERLIRSRVEAPGSPGYLALHAFNFALAQPMVREVRFNPKAKWGMGGVPHSGRLQIEARDGDHRELILLGEQDGTVLVETARRLGYASSIV